MDPQWKDFPTVEGHLNAGTHEIGNAIHIGAVDTGAAASAIYTARNSWRRCYSATSGGIYYLPENTELTDTDSTYIETSGILGGMMYCDSCTATMTNPYFEDNNAYDGGVFYLLDEADITLDGAVLNYGMALNNGGAFYADKTAGDVPSSVSFLNCGSLPSDYFQIY